LPFDRRTRRLGSATLGLIALGAVAGTLSANPALAAGVISAVTTVSCSVTGANSCISGNNTSSGIGVIAASKSGSGLKATSVSGTAIVAQTTSGVSAINATAANGAGYRAVNASAGDTGVGLVGTAGTQGIGVAGQGGNVGIDGYSAAGNAVYGETKTGTGLQGDADTSGIGVAGTAEQSGIGVSGSSSSGTAVQGKSQTGYGGYFASSNYGVFANTSGCVSFVGRNNNGNASDIQGSNIGLLGRAPAAGFPLVLTDASPRTVFEVDGYGDVAYTGSLAQVGSLNGGGKARSFGPKSAQPTIEDSGTAQLVNGVAVVRLDPTFAASIDSTTPYRVFVTPAGDTHGLFVASRSVTGFVVRESQGGRSTVAFDYRILAPALGQSGQRMARIDPDRDTSLVKARFPCCRR
jgi:hypothetical protein